jgi:hypothetical protein
MRWMGRMDIAPSRAAWDAPVRPNDE